MKLIIFVFILQIIFMKKQTMRKIYFSLLLLFLVSACTKNEDDCDSIVCGPNKSCIEGVCRCDPGVNCLPGPEQIEITKIEILRFPENNVNSNNWDINGKPDLFLTVYQSINPIYKLNTVIQEAESDSIYSIENISTAIMLNFNEQHVISLYDDDGNLTDEFIGAVLFTPYNETTEAKPSTKIIDTNGDVAFKLHLKYSNF
jgi:hypothetical protein